MKQKAEDGKPVAVKGVRQFFEDLQSLKQQKVKKSLQKQRKILLH